MAQSKNQPQLNTSNLLYYFGGLIAIAAMTLFMSLAWEMFAGAGIFFICLLYAGISFKLVHHFIAQNLDIPAGVCLAFVTSITPLAMYGLQAWLGIWPDGTVYRDYHHFIQWHWIYLELVTILVAVILIKLYRFSFVMMPMSITLWYLSMDLSAFYWQDNLSWHMRWLVSLYFGLAMFVLAVYVDLRSKSKIDYAFWLYITAVITFWLGLSVIDYDNHLQRFGYFVVNLLLMMIGVMLRRRVFIVFSALGCLWYLGYLAYDVFEDSLLFPFVLTLLGAMTIYLGLLWQKHQAGMLEKINRVLPRAVSNMLNNRQ